MSQGNGSHAGTMEDGVARWHRSTPIGTVIDVGASNGMWSRMALKYWPEAAYFLIEAQANPHEPALRTFQSEFPNVSYVIAAASDQPGTVYFQASDPLGGVASHSTFHTNNIEVPATTVDTEVSLRGLKGPFLLKLDTHGFEVPIFEGAVQTLQHTSLLIVEVYNFKLIDGCLRFHEMCAYLEKLGFRCLDICDVMRRRDHSFWQCDLFFAPASRPEFQLNYYDVPSE
jgi:FkbM family methyltransferase